MQAPRSGRLPADLLAMLRRAEAAVARTGSMFEVHLGRQMRDHGIDPAASGPRFTEALEILAGRAEVRLQ